MMDMQTNLHNKLKLIKIHKTITYHYNNQEYGKKLMKLFIRERKNGTIIFF